MNLPDEIIEHILSFNRFHRVEFNMVLNQLTYLTNEYHNLRQSSKLACYYRLPNTYNNDYNDIANMIMPFRRLASYTSNITIPEYILLKTNQKRIINT